MSTAALSPSSSSTPIRLRLTRPHAAQLTILNEARRFNVLVCGRRFGKTSLTEELCKRVLDGWPIGYFAPTYKYLVETWRMLYQAYAPAMSRISVQERRFEFPTGGLIEFWTLEDPNAGRSRKYRRVIIDEAGLVAHLGAAWEAGIRPALADYEGDGWLMGTPKGRNFFWECYQRGLDHTQPDWACWQLPTSANPFIRPSEIESMRREMTERRFAQEILAQFLDDAGGVFRNVRQVATGKPQEPQSGTQYIYGVDWGRQVDYTAISVWDAAERREVLLDRFNAIEYKQQQGRLLGHTSRYPPQVIIAEQNSIGTPIIEDLVRLDLPVQPFVTTNATKAQIIDDLALAFEQQSVTLLDDPIGIAELEAFEAQRLPSGLTRYSAPDGMHDDTVMARALAHSGVRSSGSLLLWGDGADDD